MSGTDYKLHLKFHCDQEVNDMLMNENGSKRYCEQCDRNLVDFRNHSMEEILRYKKSLDGEKFCGIFRPEHIRTEIVIQPRFESRKSIFSNSLMVLATLSLLTACQGESSSVKTSKSKKIEQPQEKDTVKVMKKECVKDTTKNVIIKEIKPIERIPTPWPPPFVGIEEEPEPDPTYTTVYEESKQQEEIFTIVEKMPEFPGGEAKMMEYLKKEIKYPEIAKEQGLQGTVYIKFVVNENGDITNPLILKTPDKIFDEPSLSVIRRMPKWTPGEQAGRKVKVYFTLPIRYKLGQ